MVKRDEHGRALFDLQLPDSFLDEHPQPDVAIWSWLEEAGKIPLPPYIQRAPDEADKTRYQTVFAREPGAVAAPTAGLHFTDEMLETLKQRGVKVCYVTLHVGPGTFLPVKSEGLDDHVMHHERYIVPLNTQKLLRSGRPVIAVGTTVVRALESFMTLIETKASQWGEAYEQSTDIFISPGYRWRIVDGLITNFHLPQSTLLMLVSSFAGYDRTMHAYHRAVDEELKFYSYGDSSVFWRPQSRWRYEPKSISS
jgi:S-adenosylmethionine:tRNA ribosyltransferase-isomerase